MLVAGRRLPVASAGADLVVLDLHGNSRTLIHGGVSDPAWQPVTARAT